MNRELYQHYHFYWWCHRQHHLQLKRTRLILTVLSLILLAAGNIAGPLLSNVWVLAGLTWASVVLKGFMEYRKYETKVDLSRLAYTSYAKCLTRGLTMNVDELVYQRPDRVNGSIKGDALDEKLKSHGTSQTTIPATGQEKKESTMSWSPTFHTPPNVTNSEVEGTTERSSL